jgi:hypothetical protein
MSLDVRNFFIHLLQILTPRLNLRKQLNRCLNNTL